MLKSSLTAIMLSSVALVPAATVGVFVTADAAYAKSDKAGGNGGGKGASKGGKSSGAKSKAAKGGKSKTKTARSGGGSGKARGGLNVGDDPVGKFIKRVTGQDKKRAKTTRTAKVRSAPKAAKTPKPERVAKVKYGMHPSNLGNMNGALNANINAVLAHVRNGNTNGPVGHLAALAVANVNAEGAQEIVDVNADYQELADLLGDQSVQDYLDQRNGVTDPAVEEALTNLEGLSEGDEGYDEAQQALENALGDRTLEEYEAQATGDGGDPLIDEAIAKVGGNAEDGTLPPDGPTEEEVAQAEADLAAQDAAEQDILSYWNKNPDADPEMISEEEQALLDKLNARLIGETDAIKDAMGDDGMVMDDDDDLDPVDEEEGEEVVVVAE